MRIPASLMTLTCIIVLIFGAIAASTSTSPEPTTDNVPLDELLTEFGDPLPATKFNTEKAYYKKETPAFPQEEHLRLIGRISKGVLKIAHHKGAGKWWNCGEVVAPKDEQDLALKWAYRIVYLAWEYSDNGSNAVQALNAFRLSVQLIYGNSYRYPPSGRIIAYFRRDTASAAQYAARHFSNAT